MRHPTILVSHRRDVQIVPVQSPVLAVAAQHHVALTLLLEREAHGVELGLFDVRRLQEARIAAQGLGARVAGDALECRIDVDDRQFRLPVLRDDYCVGARFDGPIPQFQRFLPGRDQIQPPAHQQVQQPARRDDEKPSREQLLPGERFQLKIDEQRDRDPALKQDPRAHQYDVQHRDSQRHALGPSQAAGGGRLCAY